MIIKERFWASVGAKALYGISLEKVDITAEYVENCIPDRENVHQALEDLISKDIPYDLEFEIQPLDQKEPRIIISKAILDKNETGQPIKIAGVIQDVTLRKSAEVKLAASEERYRYLIEVASDAIFLIDKNGIFVEVNENACKLLGYSKEEFLAMSINQVDKNFPIDAFIDFRANTENGKSVIFETIYIHKDGHQIAVEVSGSKCMIQGQIVYFGLARDITERQNAEERLRASEERFKLAVEGTNDGLWDWDLQTNYAYHSDRFATMLGYEPEELPYTSAAWSDLIHPDDLADAQNNVENYFAGKTEIYKSTFRMLCKEGYYRWITGRGKALWDEKGEPYRFIGFNTDITTRKNAEKEFIKSQENYHRLYDTLTEGVMFINQKAEIIDANPAAQRILNFSLHEIRGTKSEPLKWKSFHEDGSDFSIEEEPISLSLSQGKYCQNVLMGLIDSRSGKTIWLSVNSAPIYENDSDQPSGAYSIFSDVTERKQVEDELKKTNETLLAAQDMANIGYWTYEIKTGIMTWSNKMYTIFGIDPSKEAPTYEQHKNLIHPDDWEMFDESAKKCREGVPNNLKLKINFSDNTTHHIVTQGFPRCNETGEIFEIFGTTLDVTEYKKKEIELEQHRNNLELLVQERTEKLEKQNKDLRHYHELFISREFRIKELKDEIQTLKEKVSKK